MEPVAESHRASATQVATNYGETHQVSPEPIIEAPRTSSPVEERHSRPVAEPAPINRPMERREPTMAVNVPRPSFSSAEPVAVSAPSDRVQYLVALSVFVVTIIIMLVLAIAVVRV